MVLLCLRLRAQLRDLPQSSGLGGQPPGDMDVAPLLIAFLTALATAITLLYDDIHLPARGSPLARPLHRLRKVVDVLALLRRPFKRRNQLSYLFRQAGPWRYRTEGSRGNGSLGLLHRRMA